MIGVTLTADQIRNAPAPVRQWIEQELTAALALAPRPPASAPPQAAHLVACSVDDVTGVLDRIEGVLAAVNVFLEFGRTGIVYGQPGMMAFRLMDIMHHTRLQTVDQVMACLDMINRALIEVKSDPSVRFCSFDTEGHCFIAPQTQASIAALWQDMITRQHAARMDAKAAPAA